MAALLKQEFQIEADLETGRFGEFAIPIGDRIVAQRTGLGLPKDTDVVEAVRAHFRYMEHTQKA